MHTIIVWQFDVAGKISRPNYSPEVEIDSIYQPEPLAWLYQPSAGGFDSQSRIYRGYDRSLRTRTLRPSRPVCLELHAGDLVNLTDSEGATAVLLLALDERGENAFERINLADNTPVPLNRQQDPVSAGLQQVEQWYRSRGGSQFATISAVRIFDSNTLAGEAFVLRAVQPVTLWLLIDPFTNLTDDHLSAGGMGGAVTFEHVRNGRSANVLPEPLGDVRDEFTVSRGTAQAYTVAAGETIQIIDVDGQQCSDFMAMNAQALQQGQERYIDSTVTRSMVRGAYPIPGLFDKFFDQDIRPLLKLKQDTVGRHDTFAYACTARGYEERGFFGHLNCSDNISHAYGKYGIEPRTAWPAINFFFNSWIDHGDNLIQSDEAWSQPGDYIALEAMTDLVAVSTACPDDVDPINGWKPH